MSLSGTTQSASNSSRAAPFCWAWACRPVRQRAAAAAPLHMVALPLRPAHARSLARLVPIPHSGLCTPIVYPLRLFEEAATESRITMLDNGRPWGHEAAYYTLYIIQRLMQPHIRKNLCCALICVTVRTQNGDGLPLPARTCFSFLQNSYILAAARICVGTTSRPVARRQNRGRHRPIRQGAGACANVAARVLAGSTANLVADRSANRASLDW